MTLDPLLVCKHALFVVVPLQSGPFALSPGALEAIGCASFSLDNKHVYQTPKVVLPPRRREAQTYKKPIDDDVDEDPSKEGTLVALIIEKSSVPTGVAREFRPSFTDNSRRARANKAGNETIRTGSTATHHSFIHDKSSTFTIAQQQ